jgi:hypothetical protein
MGGLEEEQDTFSVWPENWPIVRVFLLVQTQWNVGPMGGFSGLRYEAVDVVMRRVRVWDDILEKMVPIEDHDGEIFEGVQMMELAAMEVLNAKKD